MYVDISVRYEQPSSSIIPVMLTLIIVISTVVAIVCFTAVAIILIRKHKRKTPKEMIIIQEREAPKIIYCHECGAEILDKSKSFCSGCGTKIIK